MGLLPGDVYAMIIGRMARVEYYHDVTAPAARALLPAAFASVCDGSGRVLLVRRADDGYGELSGAGSKSGSRPRPR